MKTHREDDGTIVVSLERGDDLRACVEGLAETHKIEAAEVSAIGAIEDVVLGYYDLETKTYLKRPFRYILELVSLQGNITLKDGKPFLHAHVAIAGKDHLVYGGHLFEATVAVVVELFMRPLKTPLKRVLCEEIGLARWEPGA